MPLRLKLQEVRSAAKDGADEIDMVINRGNFLAGEYDRVFDEIAATKEVCGNAHLKVILETGELQTYDNVRLASDIATCAGADFIKTSTGKISPAATMPVTLVMLEAIRDFFYETGMRIGMKPAGGIRTAKQALAYLVMLKETLGDDWLTPDLFRFGASTLVNDVLMQIVKTVDGRYQGADSDPARDRGQSRGRRRAGDEHRASAGVRGDGARRRQVRRSGVLRGRAAQRHLPEPNATR